MAVFKCKMCGGSLEVSDGVTVCECEYCGTSQTIPKTRDDVAANLFNRANNLRSRCEFDKAQEIYEKIVNSDPNEAEAYWGMVLCKYGIEYVEDPATFRKVPTCHRTQLESVKTDVDYRAALEHADAVQRDLYEKEAEEIDRLQRDILAIVRNEQPFDVFICYKETDDSGRRTQDSVTANDIYHQLTQEGFKVFYAAITLEDKLGQEYEPYIYAALTSAKVMLVIGSKPEYFSAVWVKNEWSRFLKIAQGDRSKLLIPCYKDMDAYDLPEEFSHLQAQDMSKIGFMSDIVRGIRKVIRTDEPVQQNAVRASAPVQDSGIEPLLKRVEIFLEDRDWDNAKAYCEKVLDKDPECSQAYLYLLMADKEASTESELESNARHWKGLKYDGNFQKAMRYADDEQEKKLEDLDKGTRYYDAVDEFNKATVDKIEPVIKRFKMLKDYKDSAEYIDKCNEKIYQAAVVNIRNSTDSVVELALRQFEKIIDYKDAAQRVTDCKEVIYQRALANLNSTTVEDIEFAQTQFEKIKDYKDAEKYMERCKKMAVELTYREAVAEFDEGKVQSAITKFQKVKNYKDANEMAERCRVKIQEIEEAERNERRERERKQQEEIARKERKKKIIEATVVAVIITLMVLLNKLYSTSQMTYNNASHLFRSGQFMEAISEYESIKYFKDSAYQIQEIKEYISAQESWALEQAKNGNYYDACHICIDFDLSFEKVMKDNGLGDEYDQYYNKFKDYAGRYYSVYSDGDLSDDVYADVTINEKDWTFSITLEFNLHSKDTFDYGPYNFSFEKTEIYDKDFSFESAGKLTQYYSDGSTSKYQKSN